MNVRTLWIVVGATALVMGLGFVGVVVLGKAAQAVRTAVTSEAARQQFVAKWRPPRSESPERLMPDRVGPWVLSKREEASRWVEAGLESAVVRGTYGTADGRGPTVEVVACRMRPENESMDRERAAEGLQGDATGRGGLRQVFRVNDHWRMSSSEPPEHLQLWGLPGWSILFRSEKEIPLPFMRTYLEAIAEPDEG